MIERRHLAWTALWGGLIMMVGPSCGDDAQRASEDTVQSDAPPAEEGPRVTIEAPEDGAAVTYGEPVSLRALVVHDGEDPVGLTATWRSDRSVLSLATGSPNTSGLLLAEATNLVPGEHRLTVTVVDGLGRAGSDSVSVTVLAAPDTPAVSIEPASPRTGDDLVARVGGGLADDPGVTLRYRWTRDGESAGIHTAVAPAALTAKGQRWAVAVFASDGGLESGAGVAEVTIANSAPSCEGALILPSAGTTATDFTCQCLQRLDPDPGDLVADTCAFEAGGSLLGEGDGSCTLAREHTARGMEITCVVTPFDGETAGAPVTSAPVSVLNTPPSAPVVGLAPETADARTELRCELLEPSVDPDGDPITYGVRWLVDGAEDAAATGMTTIAGALSRPGGGAARRGDAVACRVRASDGGAESSPAMSAAVVLANAPPSVGVVLVVTESGGPPSRGETLVCQVSGVEDPDGDEVSLTVTWTVGGDEIDGEHGLTLDASHFARGQTVACAVTASDGEATSESEASKNGVVIQNSPPSLGGAEVTPAQVSRAGALECAWWGWHDADGDEAQVALAWFVLGDDDALEPIVGTGGPTLSAADLAVGQRVVCAATPFDGLAHGDAVVSAPALVVNSPPSLAGATLGPLDATAGSTLSCTPEGWHDPDGDEPGYHFSWTRNGASVPGADQATLAAAFAKGDRMRCRVVPDDGLATGEQVVSNEVIVGNTVPSIGSLTLTPEDGVTCGTYTCAPADVVEPDPDDTVSFRYRWEQNGEPVAGVGATFSGPDLSPGDTLRCYAAPTDGEEDGDGALVYGAEVASNLAFVDDAPPTLTGVSLTPTTAGVGHTLTCVPEGFSDDCATEPGYRFQWRVNDAWVPGASGATFATDGLALHDAVVCRVTPFDDFGDGQARTSTAVHLGAGDPTPATVAVSAPHGADGDVICHVVEPARWFDQPTETWLWSINGGDELEAGQTLPAALVRHCDRVTCRLVTSDVRGSLSSELATAQMPVGRDCEDGNDCTAHACDAAGGCGVPLPTSGGACRPDDACLPQGTCSAGICVAEGNACVEEVVNVTPFAVTPFVTGLPGGGYVTHWRRGFDTGLRLTDMEDSRLGEELLLPETKPNHLHAWASAPATLPDGGFVSLTLGGRTVASLAQTTSPGSISAWVDAIVHHHDEHGAVVSTDDLIRFTSTCSRYCVQCGGVGSTQCYGCSASVTDHQAQVLVLDHAPTVVATHVQRAGHLRCYGWVEFAPIYEPIILVPATGEHTGSTLTLVAATEIHVDHRRFDAVVAPAESDELAVAWVGPGADQLQVRRFTYRQGTLTTGATRTVTSGGGAVREPRMLSLPDGGLIVGWTAASAATGDDGWFQRYDPDAQPLGGPVRVHEVAAGNQMLAGLTAFEDFGFAALYTDASNHWVRLFSASGASVEPAFPVATATVGHDATIATLADDDFVVAWRGSGVAYTRRFERDGRPAAGSREVEIPETTQNDRSRPRAARSGLGDTLVVWDVQDYYVGHDTEIFARLVGPDGYPRGGELQVNTHIVDAQRSPVVAAGDDRFVVAWESLNEDGSGYGVVARVLDADANPVGEPFIVNVTTAGMQQRPTVAMRADGTFLVAWDSGATPAVYARAFDRDGAPLTAEVLISTGGASRRERAAATVDPVSGTFFVAWQSRDQAASGSGFDIYGRKVTPTLDGGLDLGVEVRLNTTTAGDQTRPAVAVSAADALVACWETDVSGATTIACAALRWHNLSSWTPEHLLLEGVEGTHGDVALAVTPDNRVLAAWTSDHADVDGKAVQVRDLGVRGPPVGPRVLANRSSAGHQQRPFVVPLAVGRTLVGWQSGAEVVDASVLVRVVSSL